MRLADGVGGAKSPTCELGGAVSVADLLEYTPLEPAI